MERADRAIERNAARIAWGVLLAAFLVRVAASIPRAMNSDEAMNFVDSNADSLLDAGLRGMQGSAHPPLSFMVTWLASRIELSEPVLRMPSAVAGTAAAGLAFFWLRAACGTGAGFIGLALFGFAIPMLELGAETRGYALEILLLLSGLVVFWLGEHRRSPAWLAASGCFAALAIATHYSALLAATALGLFGIWRWIRSAWRPSMALAWILGQCVAALTMAVLWVTHVSTLRGGGMEKNAQDGWLARQYFQPGDENAPTYLVSQSLELFDYLFGSEWVALTALALMAVGFVRPRWIASASREADREIRSAGVLLGLGLAISAGVALAGAYPFGGTRHSVYLCVFAYGAFAIFVSEIARRHLAVVAACLLAFSAAGSVDVVFNNWDADDSRERVRAAIAELADAAPEDAWVFTDHQNINELRFYRCPQSVALPAPTGYWAYLCDGLRLARTARWRIAPADFDAALSDFVDAYQLTAGTPIYAVFLGGWGENLLRSLQTRGYPLSALHEYGPKVGFAQVHGSAEDAAPR